MISQLLADCLLLRLMTWAIWANIFEIFSSFSKFVLLYVVQTMKYWFWYLENASTLWLDVQRTRYLFE